MLFVALWLDVIFFIFIAMMHMFLLLIYWETQEKRPIFVLNNEFYPSKVLFPNIKTTVKGNLWKFLCVS